MLIAVGNRVITGIIRASVHVGHPSRVYNHDMNMTTGNVAGKIALVSGSSRGLGRQYALTLARGGADVVIHDVTAAAAAEFGEAPSGQAVAEEIMALGGRSSLTVPPDPSD